MLTGLIGCALTTWYTYWNARQERALADHKAHYDMSTRAVQEFARTAYDRYTRAEMLQSSLLRHAPLDEVKQRKRAYDAAFAEWGASHQANLLAIRKITRSASYTSPKEALHKPVECCGKHELSRYCMHGKAADVCGTGVEEQG
jgi:hypothetical protein